ncbi:MAG: oligosaccharide flippase family protein [Chloroflexi bacterium]|nr:oligosaccharide flippase family protein [Chloroflexota bacterium]
MDAARNRSGHKASGASDDFADLIVSDLAARTAIGALWTYASYATSRALVFVGVAVVARLLRPEDYGLFTMSAVAINLLEGSYDLGLRRGLIFWGSAVRACNLQRTGFVLSLAVGLLLSTFLFALAPPAAAFYGEPRVTGLMQVLAVYFGIACLGVVPDALLQHRLAFNRRFWPTLAAPAARYLIAVPLAALGFGAWSLVWGQLIGISVEVAVLWRIADWQPQPGWSRAAARQLIQYSSQVSLVEWIAAIGFNLDYVLVGHFLGSAALGIYTLAFKLPDTTIGGAGWVGSRVLLPALVELGEKQQSIASGVLQALRLVVALVAPLAAGLCLLAPQSVPLLFGEQWLEAVPVVQLLAVAAGLNGMLQAIGAAFMAAGQPRKIVVAQVAWLVVLVPSLYVAAQTSIIAVAMAHVAAMIVFAMVKLTLVPRALRVKPGDLRRAMSPGLPATAVLIAVLVPVLRLWAWLPSWALLLWGLAVAVGTYLAAVSFITRKSAAHPTGGARRRLNIVMLTQSFFPRIGGAESNLLALIEPLRAVGVDAWVMTRQFTGMEQVATVRGASVQRVPALGGQVRASLTFTVLTVWLLLRRRPLPDVLHAHELRSPTLAAVCAKFLLHRPVVAHVLRGGLLGDAAVLRSMPLGNARLWLFRHSVDRFVAISGETRRELLELGVPNGRIVLIPYGVDTNRFRPATAAQRTYLRRQLEFRERKVVLVVARLVPEKGFDRLIAAWPGVKAVVPAAILAIVGDGCSRTALERQAACLPDVRFIGELADPLPYFQAADCFTLPSFTEGQPISLLEAMSTGLVCVATDIGGISEVLSAAQVGELVPAGDTPRLREALIDVLRLTDDDRASLGARARQHVLRGHSIEANALALRRLYDQLT